MAESHNKISAVGPDGSPQLRNGIQDRVDEDSELAAALLMRIRSALRAFFECIGEDPDRTGLLATPERFTKTLLFLTRGYRVEIPAIVNGALFEEQHEELIIIKDIEVHSLCEHHLLPFSGKVS